MAWIRLIAAIGLMAVAPLAAIASQAPSTFHATIERQFLAFDPEYLEHRAARQARLDDLTAALGDAEAAGHSLPCTFQMLLEAKHLIRYTALWSEIDEKLARIETSLTDHDQAWAAGQSPVDGHWGLCHELDFMRLAATVDGLQALADSGGQPRYRLRVLPRLGSPKQLLDRLQSLLISDIVNTGVDNRGELASLLISLSQSVYKRPLAAQWTESIDLQHPEMLGAMAEAFKFFLAGAQDPETGYWGAWYLDGARIVKTPDLSFTYHIVAYTKGRVNNWQALLATTRAIERDEYPYGWSHDGAWNNHNLYDVTRMLRYGWRELDLEGRAYWREKIEEMVAWSLEHTVDPARGFRYDPEFSPSLAAEYYFGVSFLDAVGYWRPERRFWSEEVIYLDSTALCEPIKLTLDTMGSSGWAADAAARKLHRNCPDL